MTPPATVNLLRILYVVFLISLGAMIGASIGESSVGAWVGCATAGVLGLVVVLLDSLLRGITLRVFSSATFGLLLGLIFASLLKASDALYFLDRERQYLASLAIYMVFGYLGMMLALRSNREDFSLLIPYVRFTRESVQDQPLLLDTNIIIDGRIAQICETGFLSSQLVVPRFVLDELHQLADSHDQYKRDRGRRGIQYLEGMQKNANLHVTIHETIPDEGMSVDVRLLHLSKLLGARLLTNDGDLTKTARLQQVQVLNLNDLTTALRPTVSPGDRLQLNLIRPGRDEHQAVGFAEDGTMIVVNNARQRMGEHVAVIVAGTTQTHAGRLVFAELEK
jgi:uncharacterized protein YacL